MKNKHKLYLIGAFVCLLASCTKVDLCNEVVHPHAASLKVDYEWGNYASEKPEHMYVVVARILNTYHCNFITRTEDGAFLVPTSTEKPEGLIAPEEKEKEKEEEETIAWESRKETSIRGGEYFMMAFTKDKRLQVLNMDNFLIDPSVSVRKIHLANGLLSEENYPNLSEDKTDKEKVWVDFNPGYKFVSAPGRVFVSCVNYAKFTTGATYTQVFSPSTLTQRIFFTFDIEFDNSSTDNDYLIVDPSKLYIEIAGVIPEVGIADGMLYTDSIRRMFLTTEKEGVKIELDDKKHVKKLSYKGYIDAFGLIPGPDVHTISGPGILRLAMKVSLSSGGIRTIRTSRNISAEITDANLTKPTGYPNMREKVVDEGTVRVSNTIQINTKKVIAGNSDGVTGWDQAFVDVDI